LRTERYELISTITTVGEIHPKSVSSRLDPLSRLDTGDLSIGFDLNIIRLSWFLSFLTLDLFNSVSVKIGVFARQVYFSPAFAQTPACGCTNLLTNIIGLIIED
jgi:hypothetical protein